MATKKESPKKSLKKTTKPVKKEASTKSSTKKATPKKKATPSKSAPKKVLVQSKVLPKEPILQNKWLRGGLLALVLFVFSTGLVALTFQVWKAPSLAKILPTSTIAFVEGDLILWHTLQDFLTDEELEFDGVAWIPTKSGSYEAVHYNYEHYNWQADKEVHIFSPLNRDPDYLKMRPNLPYDPLMFAYLDPAAMWEETGAQKLKSSYPAAVTGLEFFSNVLGWFPVMGIAIDYLENDAVIQTYTVGDKSLLSGEALFHLDEKYQGKLINYFPESVKTYVGGQNFSATFLQLVKVLNAVDGVGGWALYLGLQDKFEYYFGEETSLTETLSPLFGNEYALILDPSENKTAWLLAVQLTDETKLIAEHLRETFLNRGLLEVNEQTKTLEQIELTLKEQPYASLGYATIQLEDTTDLLHFFIFENVLFLSLDRDEIEQLLNVLSDEKSTRLAIPTEIVKFADHVLVNDSNDGYRVNTGINLFDDGVSTLHIIQYE